jgi:hypothetical protein
VTDALATPFPPRAAPTVRVDAVVEQQAYLAAYPPAGGAWQVVGQLLVSGDRPEDHVRLRAPGGDEAVVRFDVASFFGTAGRERAGLPVGDLLDRAARRAQEAARENGPGHPGEVPRFPVPSERYSGRVEVPLPILATDDGHRRGLYAPARAVVLGWPGAEFVGIGELPGFDPAHWPPPRLGDWPPPALAALGEPRLRGTVARFGACWARLLDAFSDAAADYPQRQDEAAEARALLALLEPPAMDEQYAALSPRFWRWLDP